MKMWLDLLLLVIGFVLLLKGADVFVDGSAGVAWIFKVPGVIIGLTIVAMGTSAPELAVSVSAGISGSCCPPDNVEIFLFSNPSKSTTSNTFFTFSRITSFGTFFIFKPKAILS